MTAKVIVGHRLQTTVLACWLELPVLSLPVTDSSPSVPPWRVRTIHPCCVSLLRFHFLYGKVLLWFNVKLACTWMLGGILNFFLPLQMVGFFLIGFVFLYHKWFWGNLRLRSVMTHATLSQLLWTQFLSLHIELTLLSYLSTYCKFDVMLS